MAYSQPDPAFTSTAETANTANPITTPETTGDYSQNYPQNTAVADSTVTGHKPTFAERHKAPTTKDVETNNWTGAAPGTLKSGTGGTQAPGYVDGGAVDSGVVGTGAGVGAGTGMQRQTESESYGNGYATGNSNGYGNTSGTGYGNETDNSYGGGTSYGAGEGYANQGAVGDGEVKVVGDSAFEGQGMGQNAGDNGVVEEENGTGKKKNPLTKVVEAVKNI